MKTLVFATYVRKSSVDDKTDERELSTQRQIADCRAYGERKGWTAGPVYDEGDGVSGTKGRDERPEYARLVKDANAGAFQIVIAWNDERLSREGLGSLVTIDELERAGVAVWYAATDQTASVQGMGLVTSAAYAAASKQYATNIGIHVRAAFKNKRALGHAITRPPFGFKLESRGTHKVTVVDDAQADVVRHVFTLAAEGLGSRRLAARLKAEHVPAPTSKGWTASAVKKILSREAYRNAIVPDALYQSATGRIAATRKSYLSNAKTGRIESKPESGLESKFRLSGFLTCGACGSNVVVIENGRSFLCSRRFRHGPAVDPKTGVENPAGCAAKRIPVAKLDAQVFEVLDRKVLDFDGGVEYARAFAALDAEPERRERERQAVEAEVRDLEADRANLFRAVKKGLDTDSTHAEIRATDATLAAARARLEDAQGKSAAAEWYGSEDFKEAFRALCEAHKAFLAGDSGALPAVPVFRAVLRKHLRNGKRIVVGLDGSVTFPVVWDLGDSAEVLAAAESLLTTGPGGERAG